MFGCTRIQANKAELDLTEEELNQAQELLTRLLSEKREELEEKKIKTLKKKRHDLQAEMSKDQSTLMDLTGLISRRKVSLVKTGNRTKSLSINKNSSVWLVWTKMLSFGRRKKKKQISSQLEESLAVNTKELNRLEAELLYDDPDQMIEQLRERFVAFLTGRSGCLLTN